MLSNANPATESPIHKIREMDRVVGQNLDMLIATVAALLNETVFMRTVLR